MTDVPASEPPFRQTLWEWSKSLLVAVVVWLLLRTFLVEAFRIPSGSMENTLLVGDGYVAADPAADVTSGVPWGKSAVYYRPDPQHQNQSDAAYLSTHYFNGARVAKLPASFPGAVSPTAQAVVLIGNDYRTSC